MSAPAIPVPVEIMEMQSLMTKPIADLTKNPQLMRLDLSVTAASIQMPVEKCTFTLSLSPGIIQIVQTATTINVPVLLMDVFGNMASVTVPMSSKGQTVTQTVAVPIADHSVLGFPDPGRTIFVAVDPFNSIAERNEGNNWAKTYCYTIG
jgi:hypothetical protein